MQRNERRRPLMLLVVASMLLVVGLVSAMSAPGAPPRSNKADAYGGPTPQKPKNPKSVAACNKYFGPSNNLPDARDCRAQAHHNAALAKCNKKSGSARAKCIKVANKRFAKDEAAVGKQRKAEKACLDKYNSDIAAIDQNDPAYSDKSQAALDAYSACLKKARGG